MTSDESCRVVDGLPGGWQCGRDVYGFLRVFLPEQYTGPPIDPDPQPMVLVSGSVTIYPPEPRYGRFVKSDGPGGWKTYTWVPF